MLKQFRRDDGDDITRGEARAVDPIGPMLEQVTIGDPMAGVEVRLLSQRGSFSLWYVQLGSGMPSQFNPEDEGVHEVQDLVADYQQRLWGEQTESLAREHFRRLVEAANAVQAASAG
jgi:hypothetical protein